MALLGLRAYGPLELDRRVRRGFSYSVLARFQRNTGLSTAAVSELTGIPARTLTRRKHQGTLDPEESDRLVRAARVFGRGMELFEGDLAGARTWLTQPQPNRRSPNRGARGRGAWIPRTLAARGR
ncbi:MAG: antitoxin Xre-like helix-turn-helix domain-containing protein [Gemmatimonadales bacterium]